MYGDQKQIWSPDHWQWNFFGRHKIGDKKLLIIARLAIDNFQSPHEWNQKVLVMNSTMIEMHF